MSKMLKNGPIKFSEPVKKKEPEKLIDYDSFTVTPYKPNRMKVDVAHGESRFPEGSEPPSSEKYDADGNNIQHQERIVKKNTTDIKKPSMNEIMRESSLGNPKKHDGKKRR
jgi:hypothetical protein